LSDVRKFVCNYCDTPCILIMEGMNPEDGEDFMPAYCPYDGTMDGNKTYWKEVKE